MAGEARVFIVNQESYADYKVFFVDSESQEWNAQIIKGGRLARSENEANVKVFIVYQESYATIKITHANFPK